MNLESLAALDTTRKASMTLISAQMKASMPAGMPEDTPTVADATNALVESIAVWPWDDIRQALGGNAEDEGPVHGLLPGAKELAAQPGDEGAVTIDFDPED